MDRIRYYTNWLFQDLTQRRGKYVIAEVPNVPLVIFMLAIVFSLAVYPGPLQTTLSVVAFLALFYWGLQEFRSGRSRFRKLLGILGMLSVVGALLLFGF
jgi:hypothetical protein